MDSKTNEPKLKNPPIRPFLLEITPEKLVVSSKEYLEVTIRNPTKETYNVYVYFDSFFWLMERHLADFTKNRGDSKSMCFDSKVLEPGDTHSFSIGYHNAEYTIPRYPMEHCDCVDDCWPVCLIHTGLDVKVPPCERKNYNYERPEGVLIVRYGSICDSEWNDSDPMKRMVLYLKDETEEYKKYREQFAEIRKNQERRARWGHVLVNEKCRTYKRFRDLDGKIREFGDEEWERDVPTNLKQLDDLSDEQILKMRKERKERIEEYFRKLDEPVEKKSEKKQKEKEAVKEKSKVKTVEKSKRPEDPPQKVPAPSKPNSMESKVASTETPSTNNKPVELPDKKNEQKKKKKSNPCCTIM
ncbi:hypothetical protein CAEBREN_22640 [Caenorhabditis brenneri]|uniref:Uncharacterized protein n=1 Tax=Caenorhabditis brenneri TaxID=135651 RepID=G0MUP8_CAEBE|nr:hypothetical protein CAEBREN_22640 [Caenorhabditis brenneri]